MSNNKLRSFPLHSAFVFIAVAGAIAGVDEVGRGPLAGAVVAAAVILPKNHHLQGTPQLVYHLAL